MQFKRLENNSQQFSPLLTNENRVAFKGIAQPASWNWQVDDISRLLLLRTNLDTMKKADLAASSVLSLWAV